MERIGSCLILALTCAVAAAAQTGNQLELRVQVVDDQGAPIAGALVKRSGDNIVTSQEVEQPTDANGMFAWRVPRIRTTYGIAARAAGFQQGGQRVEVYATGGSPPVTVIRLKPLPGVMAKVSVSDNAGAVAGAYVQFIGKGLLGSNYAGYTNAEGTANIFVPREGDYSVEVSEERHEKWAGDANIRLGRQFAEMSAVLQLKKDTSTGTERLSSRIVATVTSGGRPLRGASVRASGHTQADTDARGRATITGSSAIGDQVLVYAQAPGYKTGSANALLQVEGTGLGSSRSAAGAVTFDLAPGEDDLPAETPVRLFIQLVDGEMKGRGVPGATVTLRYENGVKVAGGGKTGDDGGMFFTIENSAAAPLEIVRKGITVEVEAEGFKTALQTIPASMLKARAGDVTYEMTLDRDPEPALRLALNGLRGQYSRLRQALSYFQTQRDLLAAKARETAQGRRSAEAILEAIRGSGNLLTATATSCEGGGGFMGTPSMKEAGEEIDRAGVTADVMLRALTSNVALAESLVQRCSTGDGAQAKQKHLEAIQTMAKLGTLEKRVTELNNLLGRYAQQAKSAEEVRTKATERLAGFEQIVRDAAKARDESGALSADAQAAYTETVELRPAVNGSMAAIQREYQRASAGATDPSLAAIGKELDALAKSVAALPAAASPAALLRGYTGSIAGDLAAIETAQREARAFLDQNKGCTVNTRDAVRQSVSQAVADATTELLLNADLPSRAEQCMLRTGACAQTARDVRLLMENGGVEEAQQRIAAAKRQGCNVADLETELENAKLIRDAAVTIEAMNMACRFQDAMNWTRQLPPMATSAKIVRDAMVRSSDGAAAQPRVAAALEAARAAAQRRNAAEVERNLRLAELESRTIPCLLTQVTQARAGIRLPTTVAPPTVEEIPEATLGKARPGSLTGRPTVSQDTREENRHGSGGVSGTTTYKHTQNSSRFERNHFDEKGTRTHQVVIQWDFGGVPSSLSPNQTVTITVTGGMNAEFPAGSGAGYVMSGVVAIYGDVDVIGAQQADRGHPTGTYQFKVRPNARNVEIHLTGAPAGTGAVWKYSN